MQSDYWLRWWTGRATPDELREQIAHYDYLHDHLREDRPDLFDDKKERD